MKGLTVHHYDCVEDIIEEALSTMCGIETYCFGSLEKDVEYLCGCMVVVKLGDRPGTFKLKHGNDEWSADMELNDSYEYATYYKYDDLSRVVENNLIRKFYNNEFLDLNNQDG